MNEEAVGGWHAVLALLERSPERVLSIRLDRARKGERRTQLLKAARVAGIAIEEVNAEALTGWRATTIIRAWWHVAGPRPSATNPTSSIF